jgi:two-component system OmpR family response regulator
MRRRSCCVDVLHRSRLARRVTLRRHIVVTSSLVYGSGMRVLVVEDDRRMARMLQRGLSEDGYSVDAVGDGLEAVWQAGEIDYDAVVLDLMLPGIDGFEVCRRMRESGRRAPVLMLTARTAVVDRVRGLDTGADDYLAKPFSFEELQARLRALMRRGCRTRPTVLTAGDLGLDPATRRAWRCDADLDLSAKEFALLELFLRYTGEVLSRSVIAEHVWDANYEAGSNVIDQHVGVLRRKIDRPFGVEQLETVRGAGYRLRAEAEPLAGRADPSTAGGQ